MTATRATASVSIHDPMPSSAAYHEMAHGGRGCLDIASDDTRTTVGFHGDPASIASALVWWAGLLLDGCDQEGRAQVYRAAAGLKDAAVEGLGFPARLDVEARAIGDALLDEAVEAGR